MERRILGSEELGDALNGLDGWSVDDARLKHSRKFDNFAAALVFVNKVGELAETADHHPDITFGWGYADIALTTHDRGGITDVDLALARQINEI